MNLWEVQIRPARRFDEPRYKELMQEHHYLGDLAKISETLWYIALWRDQWIALMTFPLPPGSARHGTGGSVGAHGISMLV